MEITVTYGRYNNKGELINFQMSLNPSLRYYRKLKELLEIKVPSDYPLIRIGATGDGGYIMANCFETKIAYSFGVGNNSTWDEGMANLGYDVYMYDPTVDFTTDNSKLHFAKEGIAGSNTGNYKTLETFIRENNHFSKGMILKIDVEGFEWVVLKNVKERTLRMFDQILFEFHGLLNPRKTNVLKLLKKLNKTHQVIHVHGNNCGAVLTTDDFIIPDTLEVTYLNKKYKTKSNSKIILPLSIDKANDPLRPDIVLNEWNKLDIST